MNDTDWHKASASNNGGDCVEVRRQGDRIHVRDTKDRDSGALSFTPREWQAFITGVKSGEFDREAG